MNKLLLFMIPLFVMLVVSCRAPLPGVSTSDTVSETTVPAQATVTPNPTSTPSRTPTPVRTPTPTPREPTWEELQIMSKNLQKAYTPPPPEFWQQRVDIPTSGPKTKGMTITIGNKKVKLPGDAYIKHYVVDVIPSRGKPRPETPAFVIARGNSTIWVGAHSGRMEHENIAPGEEGAFNFLKEALR